MPAVPLLDSYGRRAKDLRISITDRCNFRCTYCMPEEGLAWLDRSELLSYEEQARVARICVERFGFEGIRITGGEPTVRGQLPRLFELLAPLGVDLAMTTNGVLLAAHAAALKEAGLHRITVSLDTLDPGRFKALTRYDELDRVLAGIAAAAPLFPGVKIDTVVIRGVNDDELVRLIEFGRGHGGEVRFIEYMDVGGATHWSMERVVSRREMLERLEARYGAITPMAEGSSAPADRFRLADGTVFGIISSTTEPFCHACDRSRLTADGLWYLCLYAPYGTDVRKTLRAGASDAELAELIRSTWQRRTDRGAETRLASGDRSSLIPLDRLRKDPHLEMHTRGG